MRLLGPLVGLVVVCSVACSACQATSAPERGELSLRVAGFVKASGIT